MTWRGRATTTTAERRRGARENPGREIAITTADGPTNRPADASAPTYKDRIHGRAMKALGMQDEERRRAEPYPSVIC